MFLLYILFLHSVDGLSNGFTREYGKMKILADCLGREVIKDWKLKMIEVGQHCYYQNSPKQNIDFISDYLPKGGNYQFFQQPPFDQPKVFYLLPPAIPNYLQFPYQKAGRIWKRSARMTEENAKTAKDMNLKAEWRSSTGGSMKKQLLPRRPAVIQQFEQTLANKLTNITCVLQKIGLLDEHHRPNFPFLVNTIRNLPVSETLRDDLMHNHEFCREFSMCLPVHKLKSQLARKYGQGFFYLKCMKKGTLKTCMKHDIRDFLRYELGYTHGLSSFLANRPAAQDQRFNPNGFLLSLQQLLDLEEFDL